MVVSCVGVRFGQMYPKDREGGGRVQYFKSQDVCEARHCKEAYRTILEL